MIETIGIILTIIAVIGVVCNNYMLWVCLPLWFVSMKTKYKYVEMKLDNGKIWHVGNHKTNDYLGTIRYYAKWKEWEFVPNAGTGYTHVCLVDIADFINQLNTQRSK